MGQAAPTQKMDALETLQRYSESHAGPAHQGPTTEAEAKAQQTKEAPGPAKIPGGSILAPEGATEPPELGVKNIHPEQARSFVLRLPTPGSIIFPLLVLVVIWIFVIADNTKTRAAWLWEVLSGNATVSNNPTAATPNTVAGGVADTALLNSFTPKPPNVTELVDPTFVPPTMATVKVAPPPFSIAATRDS